MNKERLFEEQEAPLKNTDHAYVQVSEDGSPRMPEKGDTDQEKNEEQNRLNHGNKQERRNADPQKAYNEEEDFRGHELGESREEGQARDLAKVNKALDGQGQKMDSVHPDDLKQDRNDAIMEEIRDNS